ncbi:flavin reductase family protein [Variovorax sp. dw_954]|uniref:flavin reductase family protein n=1 Tax=Variovorax sp. dw_954 TaxID=2720078 RepID=UPI001BD3ADBE|nr:flavin reductase family protein [Variovorax sp. dw_954]
MNTAPASFMPGAACALDMAAEPTAFKSAMRELARGVSIVTVQVGVERSGFTATSVTSLSTDPPTVIACVNRMSSSASLLSRTDRFGVSMLTQAQQRVADSFVGMNGVSGSQRYAAERWIQLTADGAPVMLDSAISLDCRIEDRIEKHSHWILVGRVLAIHRGEVEDVPLVYWRGGYHQLADCRS